LKTHYRWLHDKKYLTICENYTKGVKMTPSVVQVKLRKLGHFLFFKQKMTTVVPYQAYSRIKSQKKETVLVK